MDSQPRSSEALKREVSGEDGGSLLAIMRGLWPYHLAVRPPRPAMAGRVLDAAPARGQARDHRGALHLQMGDRRADRRGNRAGGAVVLAAVGVRGADRDDHRLWRHAHPDGAAHPGARRHLRQGGDERGAPARLPHVRAHAPALAALPSRAQDRRPDAGARARPQRHRDHRAHGDHAARADHHRARADRGRAALSVRLALRRRSFSASSRSTWRTPIRRPSGASAFAAG